MNMQIPHKNQTGFLLIEALVSVAIFAIGILGLLAMQGVVIRETAEAQYRIEASLLTNQLIGQMRADCTVNTATGATCENLLADYASPDGPRYQFWKAETVATATGGLPGAADFPPTVVITAANQVTVSVFWKKPGESVPHQHVTIAQLR